MGACEARLRAYEIAYEMAGEFDSCILSYLKVKKNILIHLVQFEKVFISFVQSAVMKTRQVEMEVC